MNTEVILISVEQYDLMYVLSIMGVGSMILLLFIAINEISKTI